MATSNYPGSLDDYSTLPSSGTPITVSSHYFGPAITNIEAELGTDPAGTFTDVKSRLDSGLVTQADIWRLTADKIADNTTISANLERADDASSGLLGTGMTESSGVFSFPETGIYLVCLDVLFALGSSSPQDNVEAYIEVTIDNSSYDRVAVCTGSIQTGNGQQSGSTSALVDVTNISNVKCRFALSSANASNGLSGSSSQNNTAFTFIRLGGT